MYSFGNMILAKNGVAMGMNFCATTFLAQIDDINRLSDEPLATAYRASVESYRRCVYSQRSKPSPLSGKYNKQYSDSPLQD